MEQQQERKKSVSRLEFKTSALKKTLYTKPSQRERERMEKMNKQQYILWSEKRDEQKNAHSTFPAVKCKQQCFGVTIFFPVLALLHLLPSLR